MVLRRHLQSRAYCRCFSLHWLPQCAFATSLNQRTKLTCPLSTSIFASWKENSRLIRLSAYATVAHLAVNVVVLALLLTAVKSATPCPTGRLRCPKVIAAKPVWIALSALILIIQPCESGDACLMGIRHANHEVFITGLALIVFGYSFHLQNHSRRPYIPETSSRSLSSPTSHTTDKKRLLSNSEPWPNVELGAVESVTTIHFFNAPESETGYGGGMRTYEEAERHEKARLRREMEMEEGEKGGVSFPVPSSSDTTILTPLGLQWRDGDRPAYAS